MFATTYGEKYAAMVKRVCRIGQLTLDQLEQDEWGMTHADISTALLQEWDVPGTLIAPVFYHHNRECFPDFPEGMQSYLYSMAIGEAFANMIDGFTPHKLGRLNRLLAEFAGSDFSKEQYQAVLAESVDKAMEASRLFSIPIPKPDAVHQMVERVCREIETARASCGV